MPEALITIIIPTYKRPQLLKRAILSALNQTIFQIQVCIYDDASNDETEEVVRECAQQDHRVKYYRHPQNIGLLRNYLFGLSEVNTDYFSFLSDDDVLFPWFCEETLRGFKQFPECAFSAGSAIIMSEEGKVIRVPLDLWSREGLFTPPEGMLEMISKYPVPSCVLFHRKVIETLSIDPQNALTWDCDFLLQAAACYPYHISKKPCGIFLHHSSYSNSKGLEQWKASWKRMQERLHLDPHLEESLKKRASALIDSDLKNMHQPFILRSLFNRKFQEAYQNAQQFRNDYGLNRKTLILLMMTKMCLWFPLTIHLLFLMRKLKNFKMKRAFRHYQHYVSYLS